MSTANWVKQAVSTVGVGDIILSDSVASFIRVSAVLADQAKVFYTLIEGNDRENGYGTYTAAGNTIAREVIFETLVNGSFNNSTPSAISLLGTAYMSISPSTKTLLNHDSVWKSLDVSLLLGASEGYTSPATATIIGGIVGPAFSAGVVESLGIKFKLGTDIKVGSDIFPMIQWSPDSVDTGVVRWGIEYTKAARDTGAFIANTTIYIEQAAVGVTNTNQSIEFADVDKILVTEPDSLVIGRVFRDSTHVNDTFTGNAILHGVNMYYLANLVGTPKRLADFYNWG